MVTKQEAMKEVLWDFISRRAEEALDESYWEEERPEKLSVWIDRNWDDLVKRCASEWSVPEETPCGWVFYTKIVRVGGAIWFLVDLWTKKIVYDLNIDPSHPSERLSTEAALRVYIDRLPEPRRSEARERMHLMPYMPVRFYPPYLEFSTGEYEESEPREFDVVIDPAFFAKKQLPLPDVILMEVSIRWVSSQEMRENPGWFSDWKEVPEAMQRINRSEEDGLIRDRYRLVIHSFDQFFQNRRGERGVNIRLKFPGISPAQEETVKAEYLDKYDIPLRFGVKPE